MVDLDPTIEFEVQAHMEKSQIKVTIPPALWNQRYVDGTPKFDITKKIHVAITQKTSMKTKAKEKNEHDRRK